LGYFSSLRRYTGILQSLTQFFTLQFQVHDKEWEIGKTEGSGQNAAVFTRGKHTVSQKQTLNVNNTHKNKDRVQQNVGVMNARVTKYSAKQNYFPTAANLLCTVM
jgi:hypothetical protein